MVKIYKSLSLIIISSLLVVSFSLPEAAVAIESNEEEDFYVAAKAFEDGFYDLSFDSFQRFVSRYPDSRHLIEVQFYIGRCLFFRSNFPAALSRFQSLLLNPKTAHFNAALLFWIGEVHFRGKDYNRAADSYRKIIDNFSDSEFAPAAYYSLGRCLFELASYEEAIHFFNQLVVKFPKDRLVETAAFKVAEGLYRSERLDEANEVFSKFIKDFPQSSRLAKSMFFQAEIAFYSSDFTKAVSLYKKVLDMLKDGLPLATDSQLSNLAVAGIAWSYIKSDKQDEAWKVLSNVKETDAILLARAAVKLNENDLDKAVKIYDRLIYKYRNSEYILEAFLGKAEAFYNLDLFLEAVGIYRKIIVDFSHLEKYKDLESKVSYGLAWSLLKSFQFQEAIKEFEKIAQTSNDEIIRISALCQVGDTYQDTGNFDKAIETYDKILKHYPDSLYSDYVQFQVAINLYKSEQLDAAMLSFKALQNNYPKTKLRDRAQYYLGLIYFQQANFDGAVVQFNRFLKEYKDSNLRGDALYLLASSFYNLGQYRQALSMFERIFKDNKAKDERISQAAEYEIANCFYQLGKEKEALGRFKAFLKRHPDSKMCADVIYWVAEFYMKKENYEIARRYFRRLINDYPEHELTEAALYNIAVSYAESERFRAALKAFSKVRRSKDGQLSFNAALAMADIHIASKQYERGLVIYEQLLGKEIYSLYKSHIWTKKGDCLSQMYKFKEAISAYEQALEVSGERAKAQILFKIAEIKEERGNLKVAMEGFLKISYLPHVEKILSKRALLRAARICETQGNWKEAKKIYIKLSESAFQEAKYAHDRLNWIEKHIEGKNK